MQMSKTTTSSISISAFLYEDILKQVYSFKEDKDTLPILKRAGELAYQKLTKYYQFFDSPLIYIATGIIYDLIFVLDPRLKLKVYLTTTYGDT